MKKVQSAGFGYIPAEKKHHFLVRIPRGSTQSVLVFERFSWDETEVQSSEIEWENTKVSITKSKWDMVKDVLQSELNTSLRENKLPVGKFKVGDNPIDRLLGKELVLLLWAIEDSDPALIPTAIRNWLGFSKEERWWLFTMTNATTGHANDKRGWRKAIRYAITENPVDEKSAARSLFDVM